MNERRVARIQRQIKERIATALVHEISDPRVGFVTISRVEMDKEMQQCKVFWTMLGDEKAQRLTASALDRAAGFLRREVAHVLHTRSVPTLMSDAEVFTRMPFSGTAGDGTSATEIFPVLKFCTTIFIVRPLLMGIQRSTYGIQPKESMT